MCDRRNGRLEDSDLKFDENVYKHYLFPRARGTVKKADSTSEFQWPRRSESIFSSKGAIFASNEMEIDRRLEHFLGSPGGSRVDDQSQSKLRIKSDESFVFLASRERSSSFGDHLVGARDYRSKRHLPRCERDLC